MPRYVIHIGPHKTGTTYLQVLFRQLAPQLRQRGIFYPLEWVGDHSPGHVRLVQRLRAGQDEVLADEFDALHASAYEIVLISAEDLSILPRESVALLKSYLREQPVSILFYFRGWLGLLPSSWQEVVKHGRSMTFPEFTLQQCLEPLASNTINYGVRIDPFAEAFGRENLCFVSYNNIVEQGGDLGEHFFRSFLSWMDAPLTRGIRPNPSLDILDVEAIRAFNALECTDGPERAARYLRMKPQLDLSIAFAAMERNRQALRFSEDASHLRRIHAELFEKYGDRLMPPRSDRYFFFPKENALKYIKETYLMENGVLESLRAVCGQIRE